jgi:isopentenyl diphosphate isomerase/L-lactate dehydrogenase-like FMN-dependent dehydrogenase
VLIGRPYVAALAAGVDAMLDMFRFQVDAALGLLGCASIAELDRSYANIPVSWLADETGQQ